MSTPSKPQSVTRRTAEAAKVARRAAVDVAAANLGENSPPPTDSSTLRPRFRFLWRYSCFTAPYASRPCPPRPPSPAYRCRTSAAGFADSTVPLGAMSANAYRTWLRSSTGSLCGMYFSWEIPLRVNALASHPFASRYSHGTVTVQYGGRGESAPVCEIGRVFKPPERPRRRRRRRRW
ncbi:putative chitinase 1 [Rosellinia necatrix]|uniref:Putative chitinase 1 n=1 Tax=Rosellinia necatrix TaxID=77044 RepID=A0A1S8A863_ROSNE|nr:putative chitinase 1 [Rosellinia necatrix]